MTLCLPHSLDRPLVARLQAEWAVLAHRPGAVRRAEGWRLGISFRSLDEVVAATGYWSNRHDRAAGHGDSAAVLSANDVLVRLVTAARADDLAARAVLQRLLPGLIGLARRWTARRDGGSADAFDEVLSAAWSVIREYPIDRRPRHLAANLLRDCEYSAFIRASRRRLVLESTEPHLLDLPMEEIVAIDPIEELADVVAGTPSLTEHDRHLLALLVRGCSSAEMASTLEVSERTVRYHREAMVHRLRASAMAA